MADFGQLTLTKKGSEALLNAHNGATLNFSKIAMGKGANSSDYESYTDLVDKVVAVNITSGAIDLEKGTYTATAYFSNDAITEGFKWTEIGLYFQDSNGNDILYAAANAGNNGDYIPATTDTRYAKYLRITTAIGNASNITITNGDALVYTDAVTFFDHVEGRAHHHRDSFVTHDETGDKYRIGLDDDGEYIQLFTADGNSEKVYVGNKKELDSHTTDYNNPHKLTKSQLGLGKVENKSSETIRNEITKDNVTKALGFTPSETNLSPYVTTSGHGEAYTATVDGINSLTAGMSFIMIPHVVSASAIPTLNVNSLGAKQIRRRLSGSTASTTTGNTANWLAAKKPIRVEYDGTYWIADLPKTDVNDLYGTTPIEKGGTDATTAEEARTNLGVVSMEELPYLYIWKKYDSNPAVVETKKTDSTYTSIVNENGTLEYADEISVVDGVISLVNPSTVTASSAAALEEAIAGKYIYAPRQYTNHFCFVPEDATVGARTVASQHAYFAVPLVVLSPGGSKVGYAIAKEADAYPTKGEHTDGYWYEYHKQLGD